MNQSPQIVYLLADRILRSSQYLLTPTVLRRDSPHYVLQCFSHSVNEKKIPLKTLWPLRFLMLLTLNTHSALAPLSEDAKISVKRTKSVCVYIGE